MHESLVDWQQSALERALVALWRARRVRRLVAADQARVALRPARSSRRSTGRRSCSSRRPPGTGSSTQKAARVAGEQLLPGQVEGRVARVGAGPGVEVDGRDPELLGRDVR